MLRELIDWLAETFDKFFIQLGKMFVDLIEWFFDGFILLIDLILWTLFTLCFVPVQWLVGKACFTDFYQEFVDVLISEDNGLPALVSYVSILNTLVNWELILQVLSCGISVTLGIMLFKIVVKFIPAIY
jgi:hypothetical protein